ncbi:MAG: hypothetical protein QM680_04200 [Luteolibacter sp.]
MSNTMIPGKTTDPNHPEPAASTMSLSIRAVEEWRQAIPILTETLTHHWSTGQGTRVRHILWSLYTCSHLINLGDACSGLDQRLAGALAAAVTARLVLGPEVEESLRGILDSSGEFDRFDREERLTLDHLPVVYPPAATGAKTFRQLAEAIDCVSRRKDSLD